MMFKKLATLAAAAALSLLFLVPAMADDVVGYDIYRDYVDFNYSDGYYSAYPNNSCRSGGSSFSNYKSHMYDDTTGLVVIRISWCGDNNAWVCMDTSEGLQHQGFDCQAGRSFRMVWNPY